jgi:hypothetical protein
VVSPAASSVGVSEVDSCTRGAGESARELLCPRWRTSERGEDDESEFDPVDPSEPVVSAKTVGMVTIAEPTPKAMANTPTRPT